MKETVLYIYGMKDGNEGDSTIYICHEGWK